MSKRLERHINDQNDAGNLGGVIFQEDRAVEARAPRVPGPLEDAYNKFPDTKKLIGETARLMVQNGIVSELDFVLEKYPDLFPQLAEHNEDVHALVEEFGWSRRWLAYALARTYDLTFDNVYKAAKQSPLRPYLGDITLPIRDTSFLLPRREPDSPQRQAVDLSDIRVNAYKERDFNRFSQDADKYLQELKEAITNAQDERTQQTLRKVLAFYEDVRDIAFPALVPQIVDQFGNPRRDRFGTDIAFPSDHQKAAIVKAVQEGSLGVFDGTGSGKTGIGVGLAEALDAQRVLVISPNDVKGEWAKKIHAYYQKPPRVARLNASNAHRYIAGRVDAKYIVANYELLVNRQENGNSNGNGTNGPLSSLGRAFRDGNFDLLILDEGHFINNDSKRSDAVLELAKHIPHALILTGTPIRNSPDDLSRIVHVLSPNDFATPEALSKLGQSGIPPLVDLLARKTVRRRTEDLLELPPFCPETNGEVQFITITLGPTQRAVYDTIFEDPSLHAFTKVRLLRQIGIDHNLVMGGRYKIPFSERDEAKLLDKAYRQWERRRTQGDTRSFDSDFLVTSGFRHLFLGAHFYYKGGMNDFINMYGSDEMRQGWGGVAEPAKFRAIKEYISARLAKGEKVLVFSGHFVKGILREIIDDVSGEKIIDDLYSYLQREFPDVKVGRIDGEVAADGTETKISEREKERLGWQNDPNYRIILTNIVTSALGNDFTVNDGITTGVSEIGIDLPYTYTDFWQMLTRVYRFGQQTPVNVAVLEGINTVDQGIHVLINRKRDGSEQFLDGVLPTDIERQIYDRAKQASYLHEYIRSPKVDLNLMLSSMRGKSTEENIEYLQGEFKDGRTRAETMAELYAKYWEYSYSGHTLRLVYQILEGLQRELGINMDTTMDMGSGPLLLQRLIREKGDIISVDLNPHMLQYGIQEMEAMGYTVDRNFVLARPMSDTGVEAKSRSAVVCSLAFDNSSPGDRGPILTEANRVLQDGGYYILTLPQGHLETGDFRNLCKALEKFGFEVETSLSGLGKATDYREDQFAVWTVVARKTRDAEVAELPLSEFSFTFERPKVSKYQKEESTREKFQEKLVKHESFIITDPDANYGGESLEDVFRRLGLGLREEELQQMGWRIERKKTNGKIQTIFRR